MRLENVPNFRSKTYTEKIAVCVSPEVKRKLDALKRDMRKDTAELIRMLINEFLETIEFDEAS